MRPFCDPMNCSPPGSSVGFPRQEHWSGLPFPSPGDLSNQGIEPTSPALAGGFFTLITLSSTCTHFPPVTAPLQCQERLGGATQLPRAQQPHVPRHSSARLTYGREWHKSLDEKAGGRGELVGFLNQDIKAHLRKRKQKECVLLQWTGEEGAGRGKSGE